MCIDLYEVYPQSCGPEKELQSVLFSCVQFLTMKENEEYEMSFSEVGQRPDQKLMLTEKDSSSD